MPGRPECHNQRSFSHHKTLPRMSRPVKTLLLLLATAACIGGLWHLLDDSVFRFKGLAGPEAASVVPVETAAPLALYGGGEKSRLAILLTDRDSSWLGLVHALKSFGIPFTLTEDPQAAMQHRMVMVYPVISGKVLGQAALTALAAYANNGGTLIGSNVLGGGLAGLFGFTDAIPSSTRRQLRLAPDHPLPPRYFDTREHSMALGSAAQPTGTYSYSAPTGSVLASYEDGSAAILTRATGRGRTYALGVDIGAYALLGYNNRQEGIAPEYVNRFQPGLDTLLLLLRDWYVSDNPDAVLLGTVPEGKQLSVLLTHDIDFTQSIDNAVQYAEYQHAQGIAATYFIQTKYVRDWNDDVFFNTNGVQRTRQLQTLGMEIASHSVAHSRVFSKLPLGTGAERYPAYEPFVKSRTETRGASVLGELRVSRYLLEANAPGVAVASFRPGHLENPATLPQALEAAGYRFSSSVTANNALTHLPFRLNYGRGSTSETGIYEFPITIEDEREAPMGARLPQALDIARQISRYGGLFVVLTHPNVLDHKLAFTQGLVTQLKSSAWFGTVAGFGRWWAARDQVTLDVTELQGGRTVLLRAPQPVAGLALTVPAGWRLLDIQPASARPTVVAGRLVLPAVSGEVRLQFAP